MRQEARRRVWGETEGESESRVACGIAGGRRREVRVIEAGCFGLCPKRGVTALNATRPGVIHVIPVGTDGPEALQTLFGGDGVESA